MKFLVTRKEAKSKGLKWYFTGKPCKHGHIEERLVSNFGCKTCLYLRREQYEISEKYEEWKTLNKNKTASAYVRRNKGKILANTRKYQLSKKLRTPNWVSKEEQERIKCLYEVAAMYNNENLEKWHIDHKIPLQGETVSGFHVFSNLRLLSEKDNISKGNKWNWELQK